ncbi:dimethyladenosine transferase [Synergistales bacterium]|nr:dimethyladenosine transferase [Synergistales bacterium]
MTIPFNILLFEDFETLDALGPVEIIGKSDLYSLRLYSPSGGVCHSKQGISIETEPWIHMELDGVLLIPGGQGTRTLVGDSCFIAALREHAVAAQYILTVCTGSALLARTGLLDDKRATTNKRAFAWVASQSAKVHWQKSARWVVDDNIYTSSGVSAGMDMTLGFIADRHGVVAAREIADQIEYLWNSNRDEDPFAVK